MKFLYAKISKTKSERERERERVIRARRVLSLPEFFIQIYYKNAILDSVFLCIY